jgi:hypothetical protein
VLPLCLLQRVTLLLTHHELYARHDNLKASTLEGNTPLVHHIPRYEYNTSTMEDLIRVIQTTPVIDHHAHPLLIPSAQAKYPLLSITTEAHGGAMKATPSSLSHIRAVNQLSKILNCPSTWHDVVRAIELEKAKQDDVWKASKRH